MGRYDAIKIKLTKIKNDFEVIKQKELNNLKQDHPLLPSSYYDFLKEIGFGELGFCCYQFYSGLVDYDEIYGYLNEETKDLLLFGDDYQGYCNGFNPNDNWCIVEVSEGDADITKICDTFEEFINSLIEDIE